MTLDTKTAFRCFSTVVAFTLQTVLQYPPTYISTYLLYLLPLPALLLHHSHSHSHPYSHPYPYSNPKFGFFHTPHYSSNSFLFHINATTCYNSRTCLISGVLYRHQATATITTIEYSADPTTGCGRGFRAEQARIDDWIRTEVHVQESESLNNTVSVRKPPGPRDSMVSTGGGSRSRLIARSTRSAKPLP